MSKSSGNVFRKLMNPFFVSTGDSESKLEELVAEERKSFSIETLISATRNFDQSLLLGEGGFGPVFKGRLRDGREIAVKRLSKRSTQGKKEFQSEAKSLTRLQHRNVVNLLGYCVHGGERLLVYEYVLNESLDKLLFKSNGGDLLDWKRRRDVIVGIAKGLLYLHDEAPVTVIHRDIKASNILLDDKWCPKIADFGMSRFFFGDETHVSTRIVGTYGYLAPEYFKNAHLSPKVDVYSFGVVVLELISGQKNSSFDRDPGFHNLLEWAHDLFLKHRSWEIVDPVLASSADRDEVEICVHVGLLCVQSDRDLRPAMRRVVDLLARKRSHVSSHLERPARPGYSDSGYWPKFPVSGSTSRSSESENQKTTQNSARSKRQHRGNGETEE
ncbi:hypothetical protein M569_15182 [Genlisea aurea]|uniref:Protein kinase domain-containing protein n=1 Tax=Genlisea aurea TaxID=192259 RepID=S8BYD3_9LAMI|nr:hypothetical protein M569_15182 [Genlisea aurea]